MTNRPWPDPNYDAEKRRKVIEILMRKLNWEPLDLPDDVRRDPYKTADAYMESALDEYLDWAARNPEAAAAARSGDDAFLAWYDANPELAAKAFRPPKKVA